MKNILLLLALAGWMLFPACSGDTPPEQVETLDSLSIQEILDAVDKVVGIGRVEREGKELTLLPEINGKIAAVRAELGDTVSAGAVVVELDHRIEDLQLRKLNAQIEEQLVSIREIEVRKGKALLKSQSLEREFQRQKALADQGVGVGQNLDNAQTEWELALKDLDTFTAQIESIKARIRVLEVDRELLEQGLSDFYVRAPSAGLMLRVDALPGQAVSPETPLGLFVPLSPINVVTEIDELFAHRVALGQKAFIRQQGGMDTLASGRVIEVAPSLRQKSLFSDEIGKLEDRRVRPVRVRVEQGEEKLIYGQRVECIIGL